MKLAIIILVLGCMGLLIYLLLLKRELRRMTRELKENRREAYNKQVRVTLFDQDVTRLAEECNRNLDYQTECKRELRHQESIIKQAVTDIAHDFRTPLTVVKGNLHLLREEGSFTEREQHYLHICETKVEELKYMVDEFFELSMLETDGAMVQTGMVDVTSLLLHAVLEYEVLIREQGLTPQIDVPERTIFVRGDEQLLERIFDNLLGNIVKYAKGTFFLRVYEEEQACIVEFINPIEDPEDVDPERLFLRSYKADNSRSKPGAGLGLYVVKLLAEKQGAEVSACRNENELVIRLKLIMMEKK